MNKKTPLLILSATIAVLTVIIALMFGSRKQEEPVPAVMTSERPSESQQEPLDKQYLPKAGSKIDTEKLVGLTAGLGYLVATLNGEGDVDPGKLAQYEQECRTGFQKSGGIPPWAKIAPTANAEECKTLSTADLAAMCFGTSVFARVRLSSSQICPAYALIELKVYYPAYAEFFSREDAWKGWLATYSRYASAIAAKSDKRALMDAMMGLQTLNALFWLPALREQVRGRELLFIEAQLEVLKAMRAYITADNNASTSSETPFFSLTLPASVVSTALALMIQSSEPRARDAVEKIRQARVPEKFTPGDVKDFLDVAISHIERFCSPIASHADNQIDSKQMPSR